MSRGRLSRGTSAVPTLRFGIYFDVPDLVLGAGEAMRRREFIAFVGSTAVAWPPMARAQQPAMPVVGFINAGTADASTRRVAAFRKGLSEAGYAEGQNVMVEYRWLEGHYERLPAVVADLVQRRVAVIATPGGLVATRPGSMVLPLKSTPSGSDSCVSSCRS
jgi:putative tryptophan/tyrosine transport system substrate-binding protein